MNEFFTTQLIARPEAQPEAQHVMPETPQAKKIEDFKINRWCDECENDTFEAIIDGPNSIILFCKRCDAPKFLDGKTWHQVE